MTLPLIQNIFISGFIALVSVYLIIVGLLSSFRYWQNVQHKQHDLVDSINALLPQTQCGQCGFEGCLPYARAIAKGTQINQCPPGGQITIARVAELLNEKTLPLNPAHGSVTPFKVAYIREDECIGCTKCIKACPVDAILGGAKLMHTVIASECTGCDLCVAPCPVDCIDMIPVPLTIGWQQQMPSQLPTLAYAVDRAL